MIYINRRLGDNYKLMDRVGEDHKRRIWWTLDLDIPVSAERFQAAFSALRAEKARNSQVDDDRYWTVGLSPDASGRIAHILEAAGWRINTIE